MLLVIGKALANLVAVTLRHGAYETRDVTTEADLRTALRDWQPHMAFIDIDHYQSFIEILGGMERGKLPILAFTRKRDTAVKLNAFERGADDIVEVPFTLDEIVARPYALLRRAHGIRTPLVPKIQLAGGQLEVDLIEQTVKLIGGRGLELTPIQQTLLYILAANAGEVLTRETLLASIWGGDFQIESNVVDRHIRELRVKLGDDWRTPRYIETVAGKGYRFRKEILPAA